MKIEMAESLLASWLRHIEKCQIVQTNWKASKTWGLKNQDVLNMLMERSRVFFYEQYKYDIYKKSSLTQLIQQAEIDVLGIKLDTSGAKIYAIDVAFHEGGLNYGSRQENIKRIIKKCLRSAMCIHSYFDLTHGEIIFASPKIHNTDMQELPKCVEQMEMILGQVGLNYSIRVIANDEFSDHILEPVLNLLPSIADSSELFVRSLQMFNMFTGNDTSRVKNGVGDNDLPDLETIDGDLRDGLAEMKIGQIVQTILRTMLEDGKASPEEIELMQTAEYSRETFHLQYPLLQRANQEFERVRYYADPLVIYGETYFLCSQWYETLANNDRPYLLKWLKSHR